eukprot:4252857-Ditylum_brightwellii.AAC.1
MSTRWMLVTNHWTTCCPEDRSHPLQHHSPSPWITKELEAVKVTTFMEIFLLICKTLMIKNVSWMLSKRERTSQPAQHRERIFSTSYN